MAGESDPESEARARLAPRADSDSSSEDEAYREGLEQGAAAARLAEETRRPAPFRHPHLTPEYRAFLRLACAQPTEMTQPSEFRGGWCAEGEAPWLGFPCHDEELPAPSAGTPVGKGALDEAFSLAAEAERATAKDEPFAAVFLDCSKCYERVDLLRLEQAAEAAGFPLEVLQWR
eukprot:6473973-Amphidinium_carterae.1